MTADDRGKKTVAQPDFRLLFEASPHPYLVLRPDPAFTIVAVDDRYLEATGTRRPGVLGRGLFEVFPDNPADPSATGVSDLRTSLERVLRDRVQDVMGIQKYDIPYRDARRDTGRDSGKGFEVRYWSPVNTPVFGEDGQIIYIIHHVEDVTQFVLWQERASQREATVGVEGLQARADRMEAEVLRRADEVKVANRVLKAEIAERLRVERALRREQQFTSAILDTVGALVVVLDREGRIVRFNRACEAITGYSLDEVQGRPVWDLLLAPEEADSVRSVFRDLHAGYLPSQYENYWVAKDGTQRLISWSNTVLRDERGEVEYVIGTGLDITERKRIQAERERLLAEVERRAFALDAANKELESFSYSVSHDLRTPLRAIDGFSKMLLERYAEKLDAQGQHYLQRVRAGSQRMGLLIDDLLQLSRVTRLEMQPEPVDLSELAQVVAAELRKAQPERQVTFTAASKLVAEGDPRLLRLVLENLLGNAWKYTSKQAEARIEFGAFECEGHPVYYVRDNGAGFDMAYAGKLFGAFQRLHSESEFPGMGIGLATVQRIVHRHGGQVWAEGEVGEGATFYFTLWSARRPELEGRPTSSGVEEKAA